MITCAFENGKTAGLRHVVVHALVERNGEILLGRRSGPILEAGKWGLPAGYLDRDETAAQGIVRELMEETGWLGEVTSLFRVITHPDRPNEDRQNIALEFIVKPIEQTGTTDWETSETKWFPFDRLPASGEIAFDHEQSIRLFIKYLSKPFSIPLLT